MSGWMSGRMDDLWENERMDDGWVCGWIDRGVNG